MTDLIGVLNDVNKGHCIRTGVQHTTVEYRNDPGHIRTQDGIIRFDDAKLMTPNGDVLIEHLSFTVRFGQNVIVVGPNDCGKSSLFRTIGEVPHLPLLSVFVSFDLVIASSEWNLDQTRQWPSVYIPQKPYMTIETLRDQMIDPDAHDEMRRKGIKDEQLRDLLDKV